MSPRDLWFIHPPSRPAIRWNNDLCRLAPSLQLPFVFSDLSASPRLHTHAIHCCALTKTNQADIAGKGGVYGGEGGKLSLAHCNL